MGSMLGITIVLFVITLPIFCLIDIIRSEFRESNTKVMWVVIVLLLPFIGSILYLALGRAGKI
jgi:hypothetical protein